MICMVEHLIWMVTCYGKKSMHLSGFRPLIESGDQRVQYSTSNKYLGLIILLT